MKFHKATNLGIEIEICVEKEKYKSLKSRRKNQEFIYKYPKGKDPFRPGYVSNSENSNESNNSNSDKSEELRDILLTKDPSCKCIDRTIHTPAEIVSPRMSPEELKYFYSFLEEKLMDDMSQIVQAKTCGIHIHWSNSELQAYPDDYYYMFEFIRIMYHLRKYFNTKVVDVGFSGRLHHYNNIIQYPLYISPKMPEVEDKIFTCDILNLELDRNTKLDDIEKQLLDTDLNVYQWRDSDNFRRIYELFFYCHKERLDSFLILFFIISISNKKSFLTEEMGFKKNNYKRAVDIEEEDIIKYLEFIGEKSQELYTFDNLTKLFMEIETIYEDPKNRFGGFALEGMRHRRTELKKIITKKFHMDLSETQDIMRDFYTLMSSKKSNSMKTRSIKSLPSELRDILFSKGTEKLSSYPETVSHEFIINSLRTRLYKSGMSFYDNLKGFHMEMRIFSLDDLFRRDKEVNAQKVVNEINSFVEKTEHFFVTIIDRLNKMYDPVKKEIPESKKELYDEFFLMDKTYQPRNRAVTEKLRELFGIEKMGSVKPSSVKSSSVKQSSVKPSSVKSKSLKPSLQRSPKGKGRTKKNYEKF
jgi:hypothetical protein